MYRYDDIIIMCGLIKQLVLSTNHVVYVLCMIMNGDIDSNSSHDDDDDVDVVDDVDDEL